MTMTLPMTIDDFENLEAGPVLDAFVAMHVMGDKSDWCYRAPLLDYPGRYMFKAYENTLEHWWYTDQRHGDWEYCGRPYSSDIRAAWDVAEKFDEFDMQKIEKRTNITSILYSCTIEDNKAEARSMPVAICKAALMVRLGRRL